MTKFNDTYKKFSCKTNSKYPAVKWSQSQNQITNIKRINTKYFNVGLITGPINDIIVVDVDAKNDGIAEMEKYYAEFGQINTVKQLTPSGGYHLIFKRTTPNIDDQYKIDNLLKTKRGFRHKGIDIRNKGGYIVIAPSKINGKAYEFVEGQDEMLEMPSSLINFLLLGSKLDMKNKQAKTIHKNTFNSEYVYNVDDKQIIDMLIQLDDSYCNDTTKWLIITNILYGLNKFDIWNDWSTMSEKYDYGQNMLIWNNMTTTYDINYLTHVLKMEPIARYKKYHYLIKPSTNNRQIKSKYIQLAVDELTTSDTIIMKSCTGTGKTTTTAHAIRAYNISLKKPKRILSIISKKSLAKQHEKSFSDVGINLTNYLDKNKKLANDNIVCCVNSIMLFKDIPEHDFSNYIVYIDEISSFLSDITHNETLRGKLKLCYQILMRIVKNCHKLILSDAKITDNVFNFIKTREITKNKTISIENEFKKYLDVPAIRVRDEQLYLDTMIEHVETNNYFLCASDSCKTITKFYTECRKYYKDIDIDDKFILITANNYFDITNASEQFVNKFVFYSPSIIFGVDFSIEQSQDVFVYNKGRTLDPSSIFQQTTRTRNIRNLYYYSELANADPQYESLEQCRQYFANISITSEEINEVCGQFDETDNEVIVKNTFFELFTYNEFVADLYQTNKTAHYENILKSNGFLLSAIGQNKKISKEKNEELNQPLLEITENAFNLLLETGHTDDANLKTNLLMLGMEAITDSEIITAYKAQITDKYKFDEHLNITRCLKEEEYIQQKIFDLERDNYNITNITSTYHKIKHVIRLENKMNIKRLQVDVKLSDITFYNISDSEFQLICRTFDIIRPKPKSTDELFKLYIYMLRHLMSNDILIKTKGTTQQSRKMTYKLNKDFVKFHVELNKFKSPFLSNYDVNILKLLDIEKPKKCITNKVLSDDDQFIDDEPIINIYSISRQHLDDGIKEDS